MKRKWIKTMTAALVMTMLSGCADTASPEPGGTAAAALGDGASGAGTGGTGVQNPGTGGGTDEAGGNTGGGTADSRASGGQAPEGGTGDGASQAEGTGDDPARAEGGKPAPIDTGEPEAYETETLYTQQENILPLSDSAAAWGISYKIEKVDYTESFGDRNLEHLENYLPNVETDSQGNLSGDFKYLFLTITFTNTTDEFQEINQNAGGISLIGASLNTLDWSNDVVYFDLYWEEGGPQQFHHWGLEPGESVTSEVGWVIEGCGRRTEADDTLAERMGSAGPYELYYHVKQFDSDNEGSYFIDLGVKVE